MNPFERQRVFNLQKRMSQEGIQALVCRLPENVLFLTDYWPHHGISVAVLPQEGKPLLFVPEVEEEYAKPEWAEVKPFGWGLLKDGDLYQNFESLLSQASSIFDLPGKRVAVEIGFEVVAPSYRIAEPVVPSGPWQDLLKKVFSSSQLIDSSPIIQGVRAIKTPYEIEKLRIANEIAEKGILEGISNIKAGMTEVQLGALIEHWIRANGPGYKGARLVRAEVEVGAGPVGSTKGTLLVPSTPYSFKEGDLVMIEVATMVDGYFSDLTYMAVVGTPNPRQKEVYNSLLEAQKAAAKEMYEGNPWEAPDTAARKVLEKAGLKEFFVHITGHGLGFRYHESMPILAPGAQGVLALGNVCSIEPGIYIPGFGGLRIEDDVVVGEKGPVFLSTPREPW
ncbi:MAG: Xaa-Pro peptidase family protein [Caldiserica bacterium]|jgi:Xaa-Pro dipeptidase|nr:Xaa-Pro peptidase family protein [Caldisericota bacterium]MDH7563196.1 Xaa-Pro peptidase family protein [Caldisericota bacterium]